MAVFQTLPFVLGKEGLSKVSSLTVYLGSLWAIALPEGSARPTHCELSRSARTDLAFSACFTINSFRKGSFIH